MTATTDGRCRSGSGRVTRVMVAPVALALPVAVPRRRHAQHGWNLDREGIGLPPSLRAMMRKPSHLNSRRHSGLDPGFFYRLRE